MAWNVQTHSTVLDKATLRWLTCISRFTTAVCPYCAAVWRAVSPSTFYKFNENTRAKITGAQPNISDSMHENSTRREWREKLLHMLCFQVVFRISTDFSKLNTLEISTTLGGSERQPRIAQWLAHWTLTSVSTWIGDLEGRLGTINLSLFVSVDLKLLPRVYMTLYCWRKLIHLKNTP